MNHGQDAKKCNTKKPTDIVGLLCQKDSSKDKLKTRKSI